jgi:tetratricopeptide (TPR) repeat protein
VSQARSESSPQKRRFALESAIVEDRFMLDSSASTAHPMFGAVMTHIGLVYRQLNQVPEAETAFDQSIARFPAYAGAYQGKALLLRDLKKYESARDTLLEGIKAASEPSAELHYFLGLVYVDLKEYPLAKQQAIAAYSLGYPLPGLRDKLRKAGYPLS